MKVLVTGATGLLGNNIVRALLERGEQVRVLVRGSSPQRPLEGLDVETVVGELSDTDALSRAVDGVDWVCHCAGFVKVGWKSLELARQINVEGTRNLARAARQEGSRLVHVSTVNTLSAGRSGDEVIDETSARHPPVPCVYVVTKSEAEKVIHDEIARGLNAVVVHPSFMLGPNDWKPSSGQMLIEVLSRRPPLAPRGGCSLADARDVARGCIAAAERGECGEHYILAGENLTYLDLFRKIARLKNRHGAWTRFGPVLGRAIGAWGDLMTCVRGEEGEVNSAIVRMGSYFHYYSSDKAQRDLGYTYVSSDTTIRAAYEWFCSQGMLRT